MPSINRDNRVAKVYTALGDNVLLFNSMQHRLTELTEWETAREKFECATAKAYLGNQAAACVLLQTLAMDESPCNTSAVNCLTMPDNKKPDAFLYDTLFPTNEQKSWMN